MCDSKTDDKPAKDLARTLSLWILFISFVCLILAGVYMMYKLPRHLDTYRIELTVETDSVGVMSKESRALADSLIRLVEGQNEMIRQKYDYLLQQQEDKETFFTFAGIVVSIVLSIFGFFGYKSYKSIEDRAIYNAEGVTRKKLDEEMQIELDRLENKLKNQMMSKYKHLRDKTLKNDIEMIMHDTYNDSISAKLSAIEGVTSEIEALKKKAEQFEINLSKLKGDEGDTGEVEQAENTSLEILRNRGEAKA